jgi:hypothetical protein
MVYYDLYSSPNILIVIKSRIMRWVGHVAGIEGKSYRILMGYLAGERPLGRPKHNWVENINVIVNKIGWQGLD